MTSPDHDAVDRDAAASLVSTAGRRFVTALRALEDSGDVEQMVSVGTDDTRWRSTGVNRSQVGRDAGRRFWDAYRRSFDKIHSEFTSVTETPARAVLEWTSRGQHHDGRPVRYDGVTVLELDGPTDDQSLRSVRLYFDTAAARDTADDSA